MHNCNKFAFVLCGESNMTLLVKYSLTYSKRFEKGFEYDNNFENNAHHNINYLFLIIDYSQFIIIYLNNSK